MSVDQSQVEPSPLRSVHTTSFAQILEQLRLSVLVTTYQAGKLVILRADQGKLNTHFRAFGRPMGLAASGNRLAIGTTWEIQEFHDVPAVARKLKPAYDHFGLIRFVSDFGVRIWN